MTLIRPRNYRPPAERKGASSVHTVAAHVPASPSDDDALQPPFAPAETVSVQAPPSTAELHRCLASAVSARYQVLEAVAIGGMAVLFQLRHRQTGGLFAAKIMRPELAAQPSLRTAFAQEAHMGARLAPHPNAVPVLDLDFAGGLPWLLMPWIEGEDLDHLLLRTGSLGRDEAAMLLAQIGSLLMFAEKEGIVHADIALANLRLDRFGQYRLLDYGLARGSGQPAPELAERAGTPAFNSPEQLRGLALDVRSDLYSLGLVFFHALTGRPAFATDDLEELANAHLAGGWRMPAELQDSPALCALLRSLLATDREQRMPSAFALTGALAAMGYELPSALRSLPQHSAAPPGLRRRRLEAAPA